LNRQNTQEEPQEFDFSQGPDGPEMVNGAQVMQTPDGGAIVDFQPSYGKPFEGTHQENLATVLEEMQMATIAATLLDSIEDDIDSRSEWENMLKEGIEQLGLKTEKKEFPFKDASNIYSSAFMQSLLSFVATARSELLPPQGPVKISIVGNSNTQIEDQSDRVQKWMNYFLTEIAEEYYTDTEQALMWCGLYGSVFKKTYFDPVLNRPTSLFIKPQDFVVNYGASSLNTATRATEIIHLTKREIKIRQASGMYRDIMIHPQDDIMSDQSPIEEQINKISGIEPSNFEYNDEYELYECHCDLDIPGIEHKDENGEDTGIPLPYIVTLDVKSRKVLSIYRNWEENDPHYKKINHFTHLLFLTGLGFYGYGLAHIAGGSAKAATILLRQIMDAGMLSNFPGGLRTKGMRLTDNNLRVGPTEFIEVETGGLPIDQAVMMMPYKEPSATLYNLYEKLEDSVLKLAAAGDAPLADFNPNAPVGTTLALLEQSHKVQSSIIRRLHQAFRNEFKLLFKLFSKCLPDSPYPFNVVGEQTAVMRSDFSDQLNIVPVSDPNLSNSTQRLITWEAISRTANEHPELHNMREVVKKFYEALKVPDIDSILLPAPEDAKPLDPISENQNAMTGKPLKAGLDQDHDSHMAVHGQILQDPAIAQSNPQLAQTLQAHIQEHMALKYLIQMQQALQFQMPEDPSQIPPEMQNQIAMAAAQQIQQRQQQQQEQQPQPIDPAAVMMKDVEVKAMGIQETAKANEAKNQLEMQKMQHNFELRQAELMQKQQEMDHKNQMDRMKLEIDQYKMNMQQMQKEQELFLKEQEFMNKKTGFDLS
jgi:hypothetical protein